MQSVCKTECFRRLDDCNLVLNRDKQSSTISLSLRAQATRRRWQLTERKTANSSQVDYRPQFVVAHNCVSVRSGAESSKPAPSAFLDPNEKVNNASADIQTLVLDNSSFFKAGFGGDDA